MTMVLMHPPPSLLAPQPARSPRKIPRMGSPVVGGCSLTRSREADAPVRGSYAERLPMHGRASRSGPRGAAPRTTSGGTGHHPSSPLPWRSAPDSGLRAKPPRLTARRVLHAGDPGRRSCVRCVPSTLYMTQPAREPRGASPWPARPVERPPRPTDRARPVGRPAVAGGTTPRRSSPRSPAETVLHGAACISECHPRTIRSCIAPSPIPARPSCDRAAAAPPCASQAGVRAITGKGTGCVL